MRDIEYDSFGPWILEINENDTIPPLFEDYQPTEGTPLLNIKIPRSIDRINASPGMNLYDYVLYLYDTDILILKREEDQVFSERVSYDKILYIHNSENLLHGELLFGLSASNYKIQYNTVSSLFINRMIEIIRNKNHDKFDFSKVESIHEDIDQFLSFQFRGLLEKEQIFNPEIKVLAFQKESSISSVERRVFWKILNFISGKKVLESIHLCDKKELMIINRGKFYKYRGQAIFSKSLTYIPLNNINSIDWVIDPENPTVIVLKIITGVKVHRSIYLKDNVQLSKIKKMVDTVKQLRKKYTIEE